jgi:hypothetical protein
MITDDVLFIPGFQPGRTTGANPFPFVLVVAVDGEPIVIATHNTHEAGFQQLTESIARLAKTAVVVDPAGLADNLKLLEVGSIRELNYQLSVAGCDCGGPPAHVHDVRASLAQPK